MGTASLCPILSIKADIGSIQIQGGGEIVSTSCWGGTPLHCKTHEIGDIAVALLENTLYHRIFSGDSKNVV